MPPFRYDKKSHFRRVKLSHLGHARDPHPGGYPVAALPSSSFTGAFSTPALPLFFSLSFMLYQLKRPDLLRRTQAEADALFEHGEPTPRGAQQLDVIRRIYQETLRLHAIVPRTARTAANSFEFSGSTVPAGRQVILDFTLTHHLTEFFPDPEQFDIDRLAPPRDGHRQTAVWGRKWRNSLPRRPWPRCFTTRSLRSTHPATH